jgi:phospholipid/cholesterol/gamma-HCH transport system substrate-binding protein
MAVKANRVIRVIVIALLAVVTSVFLYLLVNNFQFTKGISVQVHFKSVGDLVNGAWVRKAGIKVGSVTKIQPSEDEKTVIVTVTMKPGQPVRTTDRFALISKGILGDQFVEVKPGPRDSPIAEEGRLYEGEEPLDLTSILGGDTMNTITDLVGSVSKIADILARNSQTLDTTLRDLQITIANARKITEDVAAVTTTVPQIATQVLGSVDRLQKTVDELSDATSRTVKRLEGSLDTSADDLNASLKSIRTSTTEIQTMVDSLAAKGSIIQTLSSPDTSRSVSETLKNLQETSKALLKASQDAQKVVEGVSTIFKP